MGKFGYAYSLKITIIVIAFDLFSRQEFRAHDTSHPRSAEIYAKLEEILLKMREHGYEPDPSWITRPLQNDETSESVLCGHSEKLAIAFNLVQDPSPSIIHLSKNLRICGDCRKYFHARKIFSRMMNASVSRQRNQIDCQAVPM